MPDIDDYPDLDPATGEDPPDDWQPDIELGRTYPVPADFALKLEPARTVPMTVYVAVVEDRHADPEIRVFSTPEAAIDYARREAQKGAYYPNDFQEETLAGRLYHASYSSESDCAWVVERQVDAQDDVAERGGEGS